MTSFLDELTSDKCPITTQIASIDDSIKDLNFRICKCLIFLI